MPFYFHVEGMEELIEKIDQIPKKGAKIAAEALYEGAGVVADAVSREVQGISTSPFKYATGGKTRKPSPEEKAIVAGSRHGVSKFKNNGLTIQTSVGFQKAGYAAITWNHAKTRTRTKYKMKNGKARHASKGGDGVSSKPVAVIANAINHGTSFMDKQPFLKKAFAKKAAAIATIENGIKARLEELELG